MARENEGKGKGVGTEICGHHFLGGQTPQEAALLSEEQTDRVHSTQWSLGVVVVEGERPRAVASGR